MLLLFAFILSAVAESSYSIMNIKNHKAGGKPGGRRQEILWHPDEHPVATPVLAQCPLHRHRSLLVHANGST